MESTRKLRPSEFENHYFIYVDTRDGEQIDVVMLTRYSREEAFDYLNRMWCKDEAEGNRYRYTLTDNPGNVIFQN